MSSWYSNLLTKTSSQISSLRSTLLSGEADGDTEDDTHVCRVLRGYYAEKGRPFPAWLPPDPKAAAQAPPQPLLVNNNVGQRYGGLGNQQQPAGGLSSLWDSNGPAQAPPQPQSLRAGGRAPASMQPGGGGGDIQRRPVGGQRGGSYPNAAPSPYGRSEAASVPPAPSGGSGGGTSAQHLLRQRLWGSRTTSPSQQSGSQGPFAPPSNSNGGGGGNYEDRFAPGGMYDSNSNGSGSSTPYMSANAPWSSGGDEYSGRPSRRQGLPTGPRAYR
ncbi:Sec1-binding region of Mso1-domain-containing protein [Thelonectria olida]|uniref:Sec1-binding region of Mso1-domain-containing protein n=1 Tax=Thelonectria olida TaxID=1576542 RepID=A0A9P8W9C7_9HYPO|nr:Sec1-binding region of Mso1-domain-containing protein [Thelonectria olida]